jgi:hypothetical protein
MHPDWLHFGSLKMDAVAIRDLCLFVSEKMMVMMGARAERHTNSCLVFFVREEKGR